MLKSLKEKYNQTKGFVKEHKTAVACTTTAVVTYSLTREYHLAVGKRLAYKWGCEAGLRDFQLGVLWLFIEEKNLVPEVEKFVSGLSETVDQ